MMFGLTDKITAMVFAGLSAVLLVVCAVIAIDAYGFLWVDGLDDKLEKCERNLKESRQGRIDDRKAYEEAQRQAAEKNKAEVERIVTEQERRSAEDKNRYQRDLNRLRNGGLRKDLAALKGSAGCAAASAAGKAASGADGENVCVSRSLLMRAAEIELGRNALIDWINNQLGVKR